MEAHITERTGTAVVLTNAAGRQVSVVFAADPDVSIQEEFPGESRKRVAIEIKGGTDLSNAYNRAGEAEKSHLAAKGKGFRDFWTLIAKKGVDQTKLQDGSPTTNSWFDIAEVLAREGDDWTTFRSRIAGEVGIPL